MIKDHYYHDCATAFEQSIRIPFEFKDESSFPKGSKLNNEIVITPMTVRTWFKIKPLLIQIETEDIQKMISS